MAIAFLLRVRPRVSAYDWMISLSLLPLGYLLAGPLGEALGAQAVLAAGTAAAAGARGPGCSYARRARCAERGQMPVFLKKT